VGSKVDVRINTASTLIGMMFVMSLHSSIADDVNARGGKDAGLVGSDVILTALQSSLGITDVGKHIAFVTSAQLDGATAQDILEVPISMTVSGNWYRTLAASTLNNVRLAKIYPNGTVGPIQTPKSYTYDSVNDSYTFIFSMKGFSTFALIGTATPAPTPTATATITPQSGGGGGGVGTSEPYENIANVESHDKNQIANTPVTYTFTAPEHGITEIIITGKENENAITLRVEVLKGKSKLVTVSPSGIVYKNVNIWAGTKRIKEALIRFKIENTWLGSNNVAGSDVKMVKWDGSKWVQIETAEKTKDSTYTYYEAKTDSFSSFAITGAKGVVVPTATPAVEETIPITPTEAATPTAVPAEELKDILSITVVILAITAILAAVYLFKRKRG
jgi:PGF-pre-PGF domain-containing protein